MQCGWAGALLPRPAPPPFPVHVPASTGKYTVCLLLKVIPPSESTEWTRQHALQAVGRAYMLLPPATQCLTAAALHPLTLSTSSAVLKVRFTRWSAFFRFHILASFFTST